MWVSRNFRRYFNHRSLNSVREEAQLNKRVAFQASVKVMKQDEIICLDEAFLEIRKFSTLRNYHFQLVDGLDVLLHDPEIQKHEEFPLQIESLKRSGAFIVMHASENYDKFGRRLKDVNDDILVLTSYIVRYICIRKE